MTFLQHSSSSANSNSAINASFELSVVLFGICTKSSSLNRIESHWAVNESRSVILSVILIAWWRDCLASSPIVGGASFELTESSLTVITDEWRCNVIPLLGTSGAPEKWAEISTVRVKGQTAKSLPQGSCTQRNAVVAQGREATETTKVTASGREQS